MPSEMFFPIAGVVPGRLWRVANAFHAISFTGHSLVFGAPKPDDVPRYALVMAQSTGLHSRAVASFFLKADLRGSGCVGSAGSEHNGSVGSGTTSGAAAETCGTCRANGKGAASMSGA